MIEFARKYYGTDFKGAVNALCESFGIGDVQNGVSCRSDALSQAFKAARYKSIMEKQEREKKAIEAEYWACFDEWFANEDKIMEYAPQSYDEPLKPEFVEAIKARGELRDRLERIEIKRRALYVRK